MNRRKLLIWVGSSKKDLLALSEDVKDVIGFGLGLAQEGKEHSKSTPLKGFKGAGVIEIKTDDEDGTYRAVYTITMPKAVFVLHVFQKKSKHGIETPKRDMDLIKQRLKEAEKIYKSIGL